MCESCGRECILYTFSAVSHLKSSTVASNTVGTKRKTLAPKIIKTQLCYPCLLAAITKEKKDTRPVPVRGS